MKTTHKATGRPNEGLQSSVIFKMTEAEKEMLDKFSELANLSKAEILRQAFQQYMKKQIKNNYTLPMFK